MKSPPECHRTSYSFVGFCWFWIGATQKNDTGQQTSRPETWPGSGGLCLGPVGELGGSVVLRFSLVVEAKKSNGLRPHEALESTKPRVFTPKTTSSTTLSKTLDQEVTWQHPPKKNTYVKTVFWGFPTKPSLSSMKAF